MLLFEPTLCEGLGVLCGKLIKWPQQGHSEFASIIAMHSTSLLLHVLEGHFWLRFYF